ncbi:MAG: HPr kinase/phosphorylase [Bryobacteraceae bacterium]
MPYVRTHYPLGFPTTIRTNLPSIQDAAAASWAGFGPFFDAPPIELRVIVSQETAGTEALFEPVFRAQGRLMSVVSGRKNYAVCDLEHGRANCWLSADTAAASGHTRFYYLEPLVYSILCDTSLAPVHASCVALDGRGLLLAGDSGAGKSCLAFHCALRGWTYIGDDAAYLVRGSHGRTVLGRYTQIRFRDSARVLFGELAAIDTAIRVDGRPSIELSTSAIPSIRTAAFCQAAHVVFLDRQPAGPCRIDKVTPPEAFRKIDDDLHLASPDVTNAQHAAVRNLIQAGAFMLRYSDLVGAEAALRDLLHGGPD